MASFLDKIKVKTAVDDRVKLDLGSDHITTAGWMQYNVAYNKELVPREKIDIKMETLVRMLPLVRPTFGRANVNNRGFFVPYRTVFPGWNDFIADTVRIDYNSSSSGLVSSVPFIRNIDLIQLFIYYNWAQVYTGSGSDYDFVLNDTSGNVGPDNTRYTFTTFGRQVYKVLCSLGYNVIWDADNSSINYSALPLLCWAKVYVDWYFPSVYTNNSQFISVSSILKRDNNLGGGINRSDLYNIFTTVSFVCYDSDYFVSAWDNPSAPSTGNFSNISIQSIDSNDNMGGSPYVSNSGTYSRSGSPVIGAGNVSTSGVFTKGPISQFVLTALKSLTDYMKRHQLVGSRVLDRYLARFGVQLSSEKLERSVYLGSHKVPLQIGDVMSNADTTGAGLGDFAGKGIGYNSNDFSYETEEYGQLLIISSIVPSVGYYQGIDRSVKHISKLDFWTPEFDNLGSQPITADELYVNRNGNLSTGGAVMATQIFGFAPRYAEYKVAKDRLTGDFRCNSVNTGEDSWYLMRDMDNVFGNSTSSQVVHGLSFMKQTVSQSLSNTDITQYNRIFQNGVITTDAPDMFKVIYHFEIGSLSPMKSLYDTYEFDSHGNEVTEDVNGVKMN